MKINALKGSILGEIQHVVVIEFENDTNSDQNRNKNDSA
jgi:hypothetical protein